MQAHRAKSLMRAVSEVRDWVVATLPVTVGMLGYDLFLALGELFLDTPQADMEAVAARLRYPAADIQTQLDCFAEAGLVSIQRAPGAPPLIVPTSQFVAVLDEYWNKFESLFIVRENLRNAQFGMAVADPAHRKLVSMIYDHFFDLGWLYLNAYGSTCFAMATLVTKAAQAHGCQAEIVTCYLDVQRPGRRFLLGGKGFAAPGEIEGHAVSILEGKTLIDFGLGNARRHYRRSFPWGLACNVEPAPPVLAAVNLNGEETAVWKTDWAPENVAEELARTEAAASRLIDEYRRAFL